MGMSRADRRWQGQGREPVPQSIREGVEAIAPPAAPEGCPGGLGRGVSSGRCKSPSHVRRAAGACRALCLSTPSPAGAAGGGWTAKAGTQTLTGVQSAANSLRGPAGSAVRYYLFPVGSIPT